MTVDRGTAQIQKGGQVRKVTPRAFEVLVYLLEHRQRVVEKQELFDHVWKSTFVTDNALTRTVAEIRRVLGDNAEEPRYIETATKRGYRFIASVSVSHESTSASTVTRIPNDSGTSAATGLNQTGEAKADFVVQEATLGSRAKAFTWLVVLLVSVLALGIIYWILFRRAPAAPHESKSGLPGVRLIPVTTLPGQETWPAFSPDGHQIAFSWEGKNRDNFDIYVKLIGPGEPIRLTRHPALDACPEWAPDGQTIAFVRVNRGRMSLLSVPALGGPERTLIPLNLEKDFYGQYPNLSWSPDGKLISLPDRNPESSLTSIYLMSVGDLEKRKLTTPPKGYLGDWYTRFSPDGKRIAFTRNYSEGVSDVFVVPVGGGEPRQLTFDQSQVLGLAWTPDGTRIIFSSTRGGSLQLWKIGFEGGPPEPVALGESNSIKGNLRPFAVSRFGRRLAYVNSLEDTNIWRFELGGSASAGQPVKLIASTRHETGPQFSPDGNRIAFESNRSGSIEIWVCNADGSNLLQLTSFIGPSVGTPRWSPDSTRIAFDARPEGHSDIFTVPPSGGAIHRVTKEPFNNVVPSWSHDGRWIYFASNRGKDLQVWKIPASGGEARQVTRNGGFAAFESADGQFLYYAKMKQSGVWRMPVNGGEETLVADVIAPGRWGYWALARKGIYFVNLQLPRHHTIEFFDFLTKKTRTVASFSEQFNIEAADSALAVSPDERWALYTQFDEAESDIMMIENFR